MQKIAQLVTGLCSTSLSVHLYHTAKYAAYNPDSTTGCLIFSVILGIGGFLVALDSIYIKKERGN